MSQNARLLQYLKTHKRGITQFEAFVELGICRLSERIREIEMYGPDENWRWLRIEKNRVKVPTRDGKSATVTRYSLTERT